MYAITAADHAFQTQPPNAGPERRPSAASIIAPWLARGIEAIGWTIYLGALGVLGSFALILCAAVMRG